MIAALLLASLTGCMPNGLQAPTSAVIVAPASVSLSWDESFNGIGDGIGALIQGDFEVYDTDTALPLQNIRTEIFSNSSGACLIPEEAVQVVDHPVIPDGASLADCVDDNGNFDNQAYEWCGWTYDSISGQYYEFSTSYASSDGFCPNYETAVTDRYGLLRVYVYLDALATSGDSYANSQIVGSIGYSSDFFEVGPGNND